VFREFPAIPARGRLLVLNDRRYFVAFVWDAPRLFGGGGVAACAADQWRRQNVTALVHPGKKMRTREKVELIGVGVMAMAR